MRPPAALRNRMMPSPAGMPAAQSSFEARLDAMQDTLTKMHALLKQMQARAAKAKSQAEVENIEMWELMLGHLDKTLAEARVSEMQRAAMFQRSMANRSIGAPGSVVAPTPAPPK